MNDYEFLDGYGKKCTMILGASGNIHLGIAKNEAKIQKMDVHRLGLTNEQTQAILATAPQGTNECGWCEYPLPDYVLVYRTMYLDKKDAKKLAKKLLKFCRTGRV